MPRTESRQPRHRYFLVAWIAVFLAVAGTIALRNRQGFAAAERIAALDDSLQVVSRRLNDLSAEIANFRAPGQLTRLGESLGLQTPTDNLIERVPVARR